MFSRTVEMHFSTNRLGYPFWEKNSLNLNLFDLSFLKYAIYQRELTFTFILTISYAVLLNEMGTLSNENGDGVIQTALVLS